MLNNLPTLNLSVDFFGRILLLHSTVTVSVFTEEFQMKRVTSLIAVLTGAVLLGSAQEQTEKTVTGWVLDSACAFTKGLAKPISRECALACANKGSQLVILQDDGSIYWPIADSMPAVGQNDRLLPYAGKRITATGKVYSRGGSQAMVIEKLASASK
jgi:hypothetical protein